MGGTSVCSNDLSIKTNYFSRTLVLTKYYVIIHSFRLIFIKHKNLITHGRIIIYLHLFSELFLR